MSVAVTVFLNLAGLTTAHVLPLVGVPRLSTLSCIYGMAVRCGIHFACQNRP